MAFTGILTDCQIARFEKRTSKKTGETYDYAEIVWLGGHTSVRLLDPSQKNLFPIGHWGTATFEQGFRESTLSWQNEKGSGNIPIQDPFISCLTDFKPAK